MIEEEEEDDDEESPEGEDMYVAEWCWESSWWENYKIMEPDQKSLKQR